VAFDDGDFQAALGQFHRAGNAGEAAADDHHIHLMGALQSRVVGFLVQGGAVVAGAAFGCRGPRIEGGCHGKSSWKINRAAACRAAASASGAVDDLPGAAQVRQSGFRPPCP